MLALSCIYFQTLDFDCYLHFFFFFSSWLLLTGRMVVGVGWFGGSLNSLGGGVLAWVVGSGVCGVVGVASVRDTGVYSWQLF